MAEFHEIGSSQFTNVTPTGTEQIQISATQKTTLQMIANLFKGQADPKNLVITDFNDSAPFSDGSKNTKVKFFVANAATVVNGPSNTGITSGNYYGIAIATDLIPTMGRVEYLLWVQGKKTLFRGYKVYISGKVSTGSGWEEVSGGGTPLINYVSGTNVDMNLRGKDSLWYTGSSNPTLTLLEHTFNDLTPTASFICAYNITPTFSKQDSTSVIHMHQNAADVAPTSGYKVYTILCQVVGSVKHFFINVAPYN